MDTLQLQEFFIEGGDRKTSHVLLHIAEPSTPEEKKKGYFFAVCEINHAEDKDIVNMQNLIDEIENSYYETSEEGGGNVLEKVLTDINERSYTLLDNRLELHCVIGILRQPEISFSCVGKPVMLLFYKNRTGTYQKMDLTAGGQSDIGEQKHLFQQIVQGKISPDDFLFISTPHVNQYFSPDRLQKIASTRPVRQTAEHLERVLSELKNNLSFGGLLVHLQAKKEVAEAIKKPSPIIKGSSEKSLHNLFSTEKHTASTLSPSLLPKLGDKLKELMDTPKQKNEGMNNYNPKNDELPTAEINAARAHSVRTPPATNRPSANRHSETDWVEITKKALMILWQIIKYLGIAIAWIFVSLFNAAKGIVNFIALLFIVVINYQNRRQIITDNWKRKWYNHRQNIKQLPLFTKILFIFSIIAAICFILSVIAIRAKNTRAADELAFNNAVQSITAKKDAAEGAMVYQNEEAALTNLQEAKNILASLDCEQKEHKNICGELSNQLDNQLMRLRKINTVKPELISDLNSYPSTISKIAKINNKILALSSKNGQLVIFNLLTRESKIINVENGLQDIAVPKENDYALLLAKNNLWQYNPEDDSVKKIETNFPDSSASITSVTIYNRRLYALDSANNQITKHDSTRGGFSQGKDWVKGNSEIKDGQKITIDGDIYVSESSGQLIRLTSGTRQDFSLQGLVPEIKNAVEVWTYTDIDNIYILDSIGKRLIIAGKDGKVKSQILATEWQKPTGMAVDTANKQIYILDQNKLYKIALP